MIDRYRTSVPFEVMSQHRVLVVEDDHIIRGLLQEALEDASFEVRTATNGVEALALLDQWIPDLILLDLMMPMLDGMGFRDAQRQHRTASRVPVIVVSASDEAAQVFEHIAAAALVPKPFGIEFLLATVNSAIVRQTAVISEVSRDPAPGTVRFTSQV